MYTPSQTLPLSSAISLTQYRDKTVVSQMLTDTFLSSPRSKILLITRINPYSPSQNETIFLVHHIIPVPYGTKKFDVEVLIYFPTDFPLRAPEFSFFKKPMLTVEPMYLVNPTTRRDLLIDLRKFTTWNRNAPNVLNAINKLSQEFAKKFPCFKSPNKKQDVYAGACEYNATTATKVVLSSYESRPMNVSQIPIPRYNPPISSGINLSSGSRSLIIPKRGISLLEVRELLAKEIVGKMKKNINRNLTELFSQKNALIQLKTKLQITSRTQISTVSPQNILIGMQSLLDKYSIEENKIYYQVDEARRLRDEEQPLCLDTIEIIVDIKTPKMLKYCAMENSILEFFQTLKKASAKKTGDFGMSVRQYRLLSIELFSIQYLQRKQTNDHLFGI